MNNYWNEYIDYLRNWAETHSDETFAGMSPACFDEWRDNECEDWICSECGNSSDSVMTISEWCEELGYSEHLDYLYNLADKHPGIHRYAKDLGLVGAGAAVLGASYLDSKNMAKMSPVERELHQLNKNVQTNNILLASRK